MDNGKAAEKWGLNQSRAGYQLLLARPKEGEGEKRELFLRLGWHVNQRSHTPDPGKSKGVDHMSLATKGQGTRASGFENMLLRSNARLPVVFFLVSRTNKNSKNFGLGRRPIKGHRRISVPVSSAEPETLGLGEIQLQARCTFKNRICVGDRRD